MIKRPKRAEGERQWQQQVRETELGSGVQILDGQMTKNKRERQ